MLVSLDAKTRTHNDRIVDTTTDRENTSVHLFSDPSVHPSIHRADHCGLRLGRSVGTVTGFLADLVNAFCTGFWVTDNFVLFW